MKQTEPNRLLLYGEFQGLFELVPVELELQGEITNAELDAINALREIVVQTSSTRVTYRTGS